MCGLVRLERNRSHLGGIFLQGFVDTVGVIIGYVFPNPTAQMSLVDDDQVIKKLPSAGSHPPFRNSILPRTRRAYAFRLHCAGCQEIGQFQPIFGVTIQNEVAV